MIKNIQAIVKEIQEVIGRGYYTFTLEDVEKLMSLSGKLLNSGRKLSKLVQQEAPAKTAVVKFSEEMPWIYLETIHNLDILSFSTL